MGHRILLVGLKLFFILGILLNVVYLGFAVYSNLLIEDHIRVIEDVSQGNEGYSHYRIYPSHTRDGFPISVRLDLSIPDTVYTIKGVVEGMTYDKSWSPKRNDPFGDRIGKMIESVPDTITMRDTARFAFTSRNFGDSFKDTSFSEAPSFDWMLKYNESRSKLNIVPAIRSSKTTINIKPKNIEQLIVLLVNTYFFTLILIYVLYQLLRAVYRMNKSLSFTVNLSHRLKNIGIALLCYTFLKYVLSRVILSWYPGYIALESAFKYEPIPEVAKIQFYGITEFSIHFFIMGMFLVTISILIKKSALIEEDWSLTI